ncbi:MAG: sigma-70 family RNA polymerase sigma factor [Polyangiales bacterium]
MAAALSESERNALLHKHLGLVQKIARTLLHDQPAWVRFDDLLGAGQEGLVDASRRYDPERGASFSTYAYYRVRGAMLDHVRDVTSRDPIARTRAIAQAAVDDLIETRAGDHDLAAITPQAAATLLASTLHEAATAFALGELAAETGPVAGEDPETVATRRETSARLVDAIDALPERERDILRGVYVEGLTIEQSGASQGLTKGWASRLHARALAMLREALAGMEAHLGVEG